MQKITAEEVSDWFQNPVTELYFSKLLEQAAIRRQQAGEGLYFLDSISQTGEKYKQAILTASVYEACATPTIDDLLVEDE